jgi:hypothetical protein
MIIQREIIKKSEKYEIPTSTVDKDWVLQVLGRFGFYFD